MRTTMNDDTTPSRRRLAAVLAVAGVMATACGSDPLDGVTASPADGADSGRADSGEDRSDDGSDAACSSLDEARRLGERYGELVDGVVLDAAKTAEDDPDVDREQVAVEAVRKMLVELDPVADELLDAYRDAADVAPADLANDLDVLVHFTEDIIDSWSELLERPDADPQEFLDTVFSGDEEQLLEAVAATERVNAFTVDECGFELSPGA